MFEAYAIPTEMPILTPTNYFWSSNMASSCFCHLLELGSENLNVSSYSPVEVIFSSTATIVFYWFFIFDHTTSPIKILFTNYRGLYDNNL